MPDGTSIDSSLREDFLRSSWLSHDARWYGAVAATCGIAAANRANRAAIREAGAVEARRLQRLLGLSPVRSVDDVIAFMETGRDLVVGDMVEMTVQRVDDSSYGVEVTRCFAAENISRAGLAATYECGIFDRIQGWHAGLGVPLAEDVPTTSCHLANGRPCARLLKIAATPTADTVQSR